MRALYPILLFTYLLIDIQSIKSQTGCEITTFQKIYGIPNSVEHAEDIVETPDHGFIISARSYIMNLDYPMIMKIDRLGNVVWAKQPEGPNGPKGMLQRVRPLKDGNYLTTGYTWTGPWNATLIIKFDENGNVIWNKEVHHPGYGNSCADVLELPDGSIMLIGSYQDNPNFSAAYIIKLDANGNIIWSKGYQNNIFQGAFGLTRFTYYNGFIYAAGVNNATLSGVVVKMNPADGSFQNINTIKVDNLQTMFFGIEEKNSKLYITGWTRDPGNDLLKQLVMIMDMDLAVQKLYKLDYGYNRIFDVPIIWSGDDEGFVVAYSRESYGDVTLTKMTDDAVVKWTREYKYPNSQVIYKLKPTADNGMIVVSQANSDESPYGVPMQDIFIIKTDALGISGDCQGTDRPITVTSPPWVKLQSTPNYINYPFTLTSYNINNVSIPMPVISLCEKVIIPSCTSLQITGKDTVCNLSDQVVYTAVKNNGCNLPVNWAVDGTASQVISSDGNSITVQFKKTGETTIKGSITELCSGINNEHSTFVVVSPSTINLGPDKFICENNTQPIHGGPGFKEYKWQDGSTNADYVVTTPGKYYVTAIDYCGNSFSDTIIFNPAPNPADFMPADISICKGYETVLQPVSSFNKYQWSSGETTKQITVNLPGTYSLTATNEFGCFSTEDIVVGEKTDCVTDLFIPNAFSPNKDGRNEFFKGTAFGLLKKFHLVVYNRYGNIVFETHDINKGWDGKLGGLDQDTGNFVWVCEYQFLGKDVQKRKGNVMLIR